ncbi:hypothetical protein D3C86_1406130 [compost metagenome]
MDVKRRGLSRQRRDAKVVTKVVEVVHGDGAVTFTAIRQVSLEPDGKIGARLGTKEGIYRRNALNHAVLLVLGSGILRHDDDAVFAH